MEREQAEPENKKAQERQELVNEFQGHLGAMFLSNLLDMPEGKRASLAYLLTQNMPRATVAAYMRIPLNLAPYPVNAPIDLIRVSEAAILKGCSVPALLNHIHKGRILAYGSLRKILVSREEVEKFQLPGSGNRNPRKWKA